MSLIRRAFAKQRDDNEERSFNPPVIDWGSLAPSTSSGVRVTSESAARSAAVTACQRVLTSSVASLPVDVVRSAGGRRAPVDPPQIVQSPSATVRRRVFVAQLMKSMTSDGNAYAVVGPVDRRNVPTSMESVHHRDVSWKVDESGVMAPHLHNQHAGLFPTGSLIHIAASPFVQPGTPVADSPVDLAREAIGTGLAAEKFGAQFFGDGYHPTVVAKSSEKLTKEQASSIKDVINRMRTTREPGVFGAGLESEHWEVKPDDSQFIDLMRFEVEQVCRFFGVPPSMAYAAVSGQSVTYANVSQADLQYLKHSLGIWLLDIEDVWSDLLPEGMAVKFNVDALLRMDTAARHDVFSKRLAAKTITVNEVRRLEDEEPFGSDYDEPGIPGIESDSRSLSAAEVSQKVYLAVTAGVLTVEEGRQLIAAAGADFDPSSIPAPTPTEKSHEGTEE